MINTHKPHTVGISFLERGDTWCTLSADTQNKHHLLVVVRPSWVVVVLPNGETKKGTRVRLDEEQRLCLFDGAVRVLRTSPLLRSYVLEN